MKQFLNNQLQTKVAFALLITLFLSTLTFTSCKKKGLEVKQDFNFELAVSPISKYIAKDQTREISISIVPSSKFIAAHYTIKYVQNSGQGILREGLKALISKTVYELTSDKIDLTYTSLSDVVQSFDIIIADNFGNEKQLSYILSPIATM